MSQKKPAAPKLILFWPRDIILHLIKRGVRNCYSEVLYIYVTTQQARPANDSDLQDQVKNPGPLLRLHNLLREATYNTRTCQHEGEADLLTLDLQQAGVMVCGLQEMRRRGSGHTRLHDSGYHMVWSGDVRVHHRGVGAPIHPMAAKALKGWATVEGAEDR